MNSLDQATKNTTPLNPESKGRGSLLPDLNQYPDADVVVFDGRCKFCTKQVKRLFQLDGKNRLTFLSLHDERVQKLLPHLTHDDLMEQMYVVTPEGNHYGGAEAFRYLTRRLPKIWILAPLLHIPFSLPFWQWGYRQIAKRRYKMGQVKDPCEEGSCEVHFDR